MPYVNVDKIADQTTCGPCGGVGCVFCRKNTIMSNGNGLVHNASSIDGLATIKELERFAMKIDALRKDFCAGVDAHDDQVAYVEQLACVERQLESIKKALLDEVTKVHESTQQTRARSTVCGPCGGKGCCFCLRKQQFVNT